MNRLSIEKVPIVPKPITSSAQDELVDHRSSRGLTGRRAYLSVFGLAALIATMAACIFNETANELPAPPSNTAPVQLSATATPRPSSEPRTTAAEVLRRAQQQVDQTAGYHVAMQGPNFNLPRWGGIRAATLSIGPQGLNAVGTVERTGDGSYAVVVTGGHSYFRRSTCDYWTRIPDANVFAPFMWGANGALRRVQNPSFAQDALPGEIAVEADLDELGRVRITLEPDSYRPVRLAGVPPPANQTELVWLFSRWGETADAPRPAGTIPDRGPGGNPC